MSTATSANADFQTQNTANSIDVQLHGIGGVFTLPDAVGGGGKSAQVRQGQAPNALRQPFRREGSPLRMRGKPCCTIVGTGVPTVRLHKQHLIC